VAWVDVFFSVTGPFNCWDRLPFLTDVATGSPSLVLAFNTLEQNFFLPSDEPYPIDSDDGCNHLNVSSNVLMGNAAWKTDFGCACNLLSLIANRSLRRLLVHLRDENAPSSFQYILHHYCTRLTENCRSYEAFRREHYPVSI